jgi:hypothetical protein
MPPPAASMDSDEEDFVPQVSNDKEDFDLASIDEEFDFEDPMNEELEVEDAHMMIHSSIADLFPPLAKYTEVYRQVCWE